MLKFSDRLKALGFETYRAYLESAHWTKFKAAYKSSGRSLKCAVCQVGPIQLHHHTYDRLGREDLDDVTPLCGVHHSAVHDWLRESGRLFVQYTREAVAALAGVPLAPLPSVKKKSKLSKCSCGNLKKRHREFCRTCRPTSNQPKSKRKWKKNAAELHRAAKGTKPPMRTPPQWDDPLQAIRLLANGQQLPTMRKVPKEP